MRKPLIWSLGLIVGLWCTTFAPAAAQGPCTCGRCPADLAPFFAVDVPVSLAPNARILARMFRFDPASTTLTTAAGEPVAFALEPTGDTNVDAFWVVPAASLTPGGYRLAATRSGGGPPITQAFVVSGADDTTPPPVTGLRVVDIRANEYCGDLIGGWVVWDSTVPREVIDGVIALEVELWRDGVMFARVFPAQPVTSAVEFGTSENPDCFGGAHVDGLMEGEELTARVRAWDMAGNATEFETTTFDVHRANWARDCSKSCSVTPGYDGNERPPLWLALPLLGAMWRARRSRDSRAFEARAE